MINRTDEPGLAATAAVPAAASPPAGVGESMVLDGHRIHYVDQGRGEVVVLIHGLGADLSRWHANIDALSRRHRVVALDLFGFGRSARLSGGYRAQVFVDQLAAVLDALAIERATLVGNSMGGWIAMLFAEQQPARVARLVLIAPAFVYGLPETVTAAQLAAGASPDSVAQMATYLGRVHYAPPRDLCDIERLLDEHRMRNRGNAIAALARSIGTGEDVFTRERVAALDIATVVLHGTHDGVVPLAASQDLVATLPDARLRIVERAGRWPQLESPDALHDIFGC